MTRTSEMQFQHLIRSSNHSGTVVLFSRLSGHFRSRWFDSGRLPVASRWSIHSTEESPSINIFRICESSWHQILRITVNKTPDILSKMVNFVQRTLPVISNADSDVVVELANCCQLSPGSRRAESDGQNTNGRWRHTQIHEVDMRAYPFGLIARISLLIRVSRTPLTR